MTERRRVRAVVQERGRERRQALLCAALDLVNEGGLRAVTHRAVSVRAGFPPGTAGNYFPTTADLVEHTLRFHIEQRVELLGALLRKVSSEADSLRDLGIRLATALVTGESGVAAAQYEVYLEASRNPALRSAVADSMHRFEQVAVPLLAGLGVAQPQRAARAFLAVLDGMAIHRLGNPLPVEDDIQRTVEAIAGVLIANVVSLDDMIDILQRGPRAHWPPTAGA